MTLWKNDQFDFNIPMRPYTDPARNAEWPVQLDASIDPVLADLEQDPALAAPEDNGGDEPLFKAPSRPAIRRSARLNNLQLVHSPKPDHLPHVIIGTLERYGADGHPRPALAFEPAAPPPAHAIEPHASSTSSEDNLHSLSVSPPRSKSKAPRKHDRSPDARYANRHPDLIRNAFTPALTDYSARAQIIRTARSDTGLQHDFTWSEHYHILYASVMTARISELNTKLSTGLNPYRLIREIASEEVAEYIRPLVIFTKMGTQGDINWMWCEEHIELLYGLDWKVPDMNPESLDTLVKRTGAWMVKVEAEVEVEPGKSATKRRQGARKKNESGVGYL